MLDIATDQKHNNIVEYLKQVQLDKELLIAVQYGNLSKVEDLVSQGASLSAKYSDGRTLMHCAAYGGELNVVKYLVVGEKSSLKIKDNSGRIPLHYAAYNGKLDIVKYFIDEEKIDVNIKDHGGWAPLYYASCGGYSNVINYLGKIHNSDLISNLQENSTSLEIPNSNNIEVQDKLGRTPLHLAAKAGDLSKINLLCDDYNANIEAQDNFGYTPIFFATQSGKLNVVSLVLYYGANINAQDMYGSTPLHYAAQEGNLGMIQLLLSRCARIELLDRNNWTPILFAARESKWSAVELLVSKGAKFNNEITYQGTPLHFAVQEGNLGMVKFLIDQGANIESQDDYNKKPLHLAVRVNRLDIVKFLLDKHANIEARDMDGDIPLELAIQSGYKDIEEVLRQAQLDLDKELLNAAKSGDLDKVKECIKRGAYINTKSNNGRTSLHWAAFEGCLPGVEYLIKEVADINAKDNTSRTPLHYAARNGHLDVVKYLIEEGADFEVKDKDDKTPLDLASWKKHNDVVKYLEKIKEERDKTVQRKRRHHHGDHARHHMSRKPLAIDSSNQPEIAASGSTRPSSWINDLFGWVKSSIGGLLSSKPVGISSTKDSISQVDGQFAKASVSNSSPTSTTLSSDGTDKKQESNYFTSGGFSRDNIDYVNANIKQMRERQTPVKFKPSGGNTILEMGDHYLSHVDFNGTIMLLDLLIRKVTGQKYISTVDQSISPLEAQGYALNITKEFEKVVEQAGLKSGVSMYRLNIDFVEIQKEVTGKIMSGKFNEISGILSSYVEKACLGEEAGKLSPKKFEKFIAQFDKGLLNQSIEQILHNRDGRLEVDDAKQMSLEPQSYLSNASVHSHSEVSTCLSEIGVTKLGGNLNR
ncbi:ankyrin repeat domain-containing protein [Wolbachia endosymbiont (group A) of Longitarsus flavicornis]|uniref:ankyrin repeat domain-containing protein n=1 Tax=Wolbachia endosymbiont (group A) of Longitarsus flavicornis TaxID=3066134 RepID=UPI0030CA238A